MDNYFLKKQLLGEIQEAIRFKDLNIEFLELNSFIARWLLAYCTKNHVRPPNIDKLGELIRKSGELMRKLSEPYVLSRSESDESIQPNDHEISDDNGPVPSNIKVK